MSKKAETILMLIDILAKCSFTKREVKDLWELKSAIDKACKRIKEDSKYDECFNIADVKKFDDWDDKKFIYTTLQGKGYTFTDFCEILSPNKLEKSLAEEDYNLIISKAKYVMSQRKNVKKD